MNPTFMASALRDIADRVESGDLKLTVGLIKEDGTPGMPHPAPGQPMPPNARTVAVMSAVGSAEQPFGANWLAVTSVAAAAIRTQL